MVLTFNPPGTIPCEYRIEAYRGVEATTARKATAHHAGWRDRMESLMAEPRYSVKYSNVFPAD